MFVVCDAGSDIHVLVKTLQRVGLRTLNLKNISASKRSIAATTQSLIAEADLICGVLKESNSPNVYLELGYALGLQRPTIIISEASSLPINLMDLLWIKAPIDDQKALSFQLRAALANIDSLAPNRLRTRPKGPSKERPSSGKLTSSGVPRSEAERELLMLLEASPEIESIVAQPQGRNEQGYIPDFAVWLAASARALESPMVIEIKAESLRKGAMDQAIERLRAYAEMGEIKSCLLIHGSHRGREAEVVSLAPLTFVVEFSEVRRLLAEGRLLETLRGERNRFAHSAG